jgi:hypothetical protein
MSRVMGVALNLTEGDDRTEENIKSFRRNIASIWYKKLGWNDGNNDSANDISLRQTILSLTVASEDPDAIKEAKKRYFAAKYVEDLPAEQRGKTLLTT